MRFEFEELGIDLPTSGMKSGFGWFKGIAHIAEEEKSFELYVDELELIPDEPTHKDQTHVIRRPPQAARDIEAALFRAIERAIFSNYRLSINQEWWSRHGCRDEYAELRHAKSERI